MLIPKQSPPGKPGIATTIRLLFPLPRAKIKIPTITKLTIESTISINNSGLLLRTTTTNSYPSATSSDDSTRERELATYALWGCKPAGFTNHAFGYLGLFQELVMGFSCVLAQFLNRTEVTPAASKPHLPYTCDFGIRIWN